jgi:hypothetical protein
MSRHRFCKLTKTNRSTFYYRKKTEAQGNIDVMNKMDEYYSEHPTAGSQDNAEHAPSCRESQ